MKITRFPHYLPMVELTRGLSLDGEQTIESEHFGAAAVVDATGKLLAWYGNPKTVTYMRSTSKPFQALQFFERGGASFYHLTQQEIALICASHSGTDEHVAVAKSIQEKAGLNENDLQCGVHQPMYQPAAEALRQRGEKPTPNRHNCSGKHTGMLAFARLEKLPIDDYLSMEHPIQREILQTFAEMCNLAPEEVKLGLDGCTAPNFAVPLYNAALAFARLCDPKNGSVLPPARAEACQLITSAMTASPEMVAGTERFDTILMKNTAGRLVAKGGAEGYQGIGLMPGVLSANSPGVGIAIKISDGDLNGRAIPAVSLEILRQLGVLSSQELEPLAGFGPVLKINNWRKLVVGESRPAFELDKIF